MKHLKVVLSVGIALLPLGWADAAPGLTAVTIEPGADGTETWSLSVQALILMTVLTLLPAFLLMMTSFTRITIVLGILRTAMGTAQTPSNQIILGLALFMTIFVMQPVFEKIYETAVNPYLEEQISVTDALKNASIPLTDFMLKQTREDDLELFLNLSGENELDSVGDVDFFVLIPAFVTSELKTAFQIGFMLFIPFLIIDLVVASVLMSMGMMMLSPLIISLPFKLMLFVLVDGWTLVLGTLAGSFYLN